MNQEQRPGEKRYFSQADAKMISWVVRDYNEFSPVSPGKQFSNDTGIEVSRVEDALKRLEERGRCDRTKALTIVTQLASRNRELEDMERIENFPPPILTTEETLLMAQFKEGIGNSQICARMGLTLDELRMRSRDLFKKYDNSKSRYFPIAHDAFHSSQK